MAMEQDDEQDVWDRNYVIIIHNGAVLSFKAKTFTL